MIHPIARSTYITSAKSLKKAEEKIIVIKFTNFVKTDFSVTQINAFSLIGNHKQESSQLSAVNFESIRSLSVVYNCQTLVFPTSISISLPQLLYD